MDHDYKGLTKYCCECTSWAYCPDKPNNCEHGDLCVLIAHIVDTALKDKSEDGE